MSNIPLTAWEQGAMVVLFVVMLVAIAAGVFKVIRDMVDKTQNFIERMLADMQAFITNRDTQWQAYADRREEQFDQRNSAVVSAVNSLTGTIAHLSEQFTDHDKATAEAIAAMKERTQPLQKTPRKP